MDLSPIADLLARIPGSAWGAVGGALLTLIPVVVSNRHGRKQQAQQLEFDSRESQRERRVNLRREVYLPATDSIVGMVGTMGKLLDGNPTSAKDVAVAAQSFGAALTRVQMVGSAQTVRHAAEYQRAFLKAFSVLQRLNHPMALRSVDIEIAQNSRDGFHNERMKCVELMKEYNLAGGGDPAYFQRVERQATIASDQWSEAHSDWLRLMLEQESARLEIAVEFTMLMKELSELQVPMLVAIRTELEASDESSCSPIEEETQKTTAVGVQAMSDMIPIIELSIQRLRADVEADMQQRRRGSRGT